MEHKPERRLLTIWRVTLTISAFVPAFAVSLFLKAFTTLWLVSAVIWVFVFLALYLIYLPMRYRSLSFKLEGNILIQRGGVFYSITRLLPCANIQYVTVAGGLLGRIFAVCSLVIVAPGGKMVVPGLHRKKARDLANILTGMQDLR